MRVSHPVSTLHRRLSTRFFPGSVLAHECRAVRSIATTLAIPLKETSKQKTEQSEPPCKGAKSRFYAVAVGREGPKIYSSWKQCEPNVRLQETQICSGT